MPGFNIKNAKKDLDSKDENCAKLGAADFLYERSSPLADLDSVRSYRWLFNLFDPFKSDTLGNTKVKTASPGDLLCYLKKADRPSLEFDEIPIHNGPRTTYRPGKFKCNPINLEFYEVLGPDNEDRDSAAVRMYEWMRRAMFRSRASVFGTHKDYTFNARLLLLDGWGQPVHVYSLYNCFPTKITPSEMNYENDNIATITATIRYDDYTEMTVSGGAASTQVEIA
jgi:hypothetical protein